MSSETEKTISEKSSAEKLQMEIDKSQHLLQKFFDANSSLTAQENIDEVKHLLKQLLELNEELVKENTGLRQSERLYHKMVEEVKDYAIFLLDQKGNIQTWNEGAENIKGYKSSEILGKNIKVFYLKEDQEAHLPERLIEQARTEGTAAYEGWRQRKDGSKFWGSILITALHDDNHNVMGFSKVTRDLTERKNAEDRLLNYAMQLDKKNRELQVSNKELQSFSYVASHDLQEPLRKIQTFGKRILESEIDRLSESGRESFSRMINAAERMQKLIDDLLAFSRAHSPDLNLEPVDLNQVLLEIRNSFQEAMAEVHGEMVAESLPVIQAIPFQIQQLFHNLINNAIKYRSPDRSLKIRIIHKTVPASEVKSLIKPVTSEYHKISISDNGIGFEQKYATKIFEIFQRLHGKAQYPGTGIGLAICKKIVENLDGAITAKSGIDEGATFEIYLPAA